MLLSELFTSFDEDSDVEFLLSSWSDINPMSFHKLENRYNSDEAYRQLMPCLGL